LGRDDSKNLGVERVDARCVMKDLSFLNFHASAAQKEP
jgi:hypothetical protein